MGEGTIFDKWEAAGHRAMRRDEARRARRAAIERAVRWPLLAGTAVAGLVLGWLPGWPWWPWAIGVGVLVLLALVGVRRRLGVAYTAASGLLVVDAGLLSYIDPWWWGLLAGIGALGFAAIAGVRLGWWRRRRTHVLATAVVGLVLLVTSTVVLAVHAGPGGRDRAPAASSGARAGRGADPAAHACQHGELPRRTHRPADAGRGRRCVFRVQLGRAAAMVAAHGGGDCPGAIRELAARVTDPSGYVNRLWLPGQATQPGPAGTLTVDACTLDFGGLTSTPGPDPSPQIGRLTLTQQHGEGHQLTAYQPC